MNQAQLSGLRTLADRTHKHAAHGYTHELVFTAVHDEYGTLEEDSLGFCSEASAWEYASEINAKHAKGKLPWRIALKYVRDLRVAS